MGDVARLMGGLADENLDRLRLSVSYLWCVLSDDAPRSDRIDKLYMDDCLGMSVRRAPSGTRYDASVFSFFQSPSTRDVESSS